LLLAHEREGESVPIDFRPGDVLLMLDPSWSRDREFTAVFQRARTAKAAIIATIHDPPPAAAAPGDGVESAAERFDPWLKDAIASSDGLICVSKPIADALMAHMRRSGLERESPRIGCWQLGTDLGSDSADGEKPGSVAGPPSLSSPESGRLPDAGTMPRLTWAQSAEMLLGLIFDVAWP
jgi:hypothetical protein